MIPWFRQRRDRSQTKVRPSSRFRRARRLSMERCEDRRMLSGNNSGFELSAVTPGESGGFLSFEGAHLFPASSDTLLVAQPTSGRVLGIDIAGNFFSFDQGRQPNLSVFGENNTIRAWGASNNLFKFEPLDVSPTANDIGSRYTIGVTNFAEIAIVDQLVPTTNDAPATYLSPSLELLNGFPRSAPLDLDVSLTVDPPAIDETLQDSEDLDGSPTLSPELPLENSVSGSGEPPRLLVIDEPIQILASQDKGSRKPSDEGGVIQVFAAVAETQQAFETKLASAVVERLNEADVLPAIPARESQPVVAQLARAVAFETVSYQPSPQGNPTSLPTDDAPVETQELPTDLNSSVSNGGKPPAGVSMQDSISTSTKTTREEYTSRDVTDGVAHEASRVPTERIDQEHDKTLASTFATWPVLASVVASYLLVERHPHNREESVQTPPRRQRGNS